MTLASTGFHGRMLKHEREAIGSVGAKRMLLLEAATELQSRPVRSAVARRALDQVASEILRLATQGELPDHEAKAAAPASYQ